jgi:hypothetical protein
MRTSFRKWTLLALLTCAVGAGCGKDDTSGGAQTPVEVAPSLKGPAATADKAVIAVVDEFNANHPEAVWDFLPESYQRDLNDVVHLFAERMDAELWTKSILVVRKLAGVLKTKKEFLAADMTPVANLVETLLAGELADLGQLKKFDGRPFLSGTGAKLILQLRELLPNINRMLDFKKITLVKSKADSATVEFKTGEETTEREFVRIEGKWIPKDLADSWIEQIGEAKARLSILSPDNLAEIKPRIMTLLAAVDGVLDRLAAAGNQDEFRAGLAEADVQLGPYKALVAAWLAGSASGSADGSNADEAVEPSRDEPIEFVTVVVSGMLDDDAQDRLRTRLNTLVDDREKADSELTGDDETTTIKVGPVSDVEAFAKQLEFLVVTSIDAKTRTITASVKK